jgi:hypothetical protein
MSIFLLSPVDKPCSEVYVYSCDFTDICQYIIVFTEPLPRNGLHNPVFLLLPVGRVYGVIAWLR